MAEIKQQSKRGGKRPGAGRKPGSKERIAKSGAKERALAVHQAVLARVQSEGEKLDPVEAIMEVAEWAVREWRNAVLTGDGNPTEMANCAVEWCAKAAPYIRPRLAAVEANVNVNISVFERIERGRQRLAIIEAAAA